MSAVAWVLPFLGMVMVALGWAVATSPLTGRWRSLQLVTSAVIVVLAAWGLLALAIIVGG